jgi:hypothetical protein
MIALQLLPIVIETIIRRAVRHFGVAAAIAVLHAMLCKGELSAIALLPVLFTWLITWEPSGNKPKGVPYIPRRS